MGLPVIRGPSAALYPFVMTISFKTVVGTAYNGYQQRTVGASGLVKFELPYAALTRAQRDTVKAAFTSAKGQMNTGLSLTLGAITYTNLSLDSDDFSSVESETTQYAAPLKLSQTIGQGLSPGTSGGAFPVLANGTMGILPYTQAKRFQTISTKVEAGPKYGFAEWGGGLSGYPTDGLMSWILDESKLSDADLATRMQHFIDQWGRFAKFPLSDEDSTVYPDVHYASDDFVIGYNGPNDSSVRVGLEQAYQS